MDDNELLEMAEELDTGDTLLNIARRHNLKICEVKEILQDEEAAHRYYDEKRKLIRKLRQQCGVELPGVCRVAHCEWRNKLDNGCRWPSCFKEVLRKKG